MWGGGGGGSSQGVCVNEELKGGAGPGGQGGCIEVIVKFEEKSREEVRSGSLVWGCGRVGEWVDVNKELKLLFVKMQKKVRMVHYVNDSVLIKFSQKTNVFTLIIISSP